MAPSPSSCVIRSGRPPNLLRKSVPPKFAPQIQPLQWAVPSLPCSAQEGEGCHKASRAKPSEKNYQLAHFTRSGLWIPERPHTPPECEAVECKDCLESVADADEGYCRGCGDPLCEACQNLVAESRSAPSALPFCRKSLFGVYRTIPKWATSSCCLSLIPPRSHFYENHCQDYPDLRRGLEPLGMDSE
jgi:hypothetical protein